jgi:CheY-like chemotaxis protein
MAKGRILVVDDEIYIVHILDFSLGMEGYEVLTALDGEQALEKARTEKPDLIVLDIMMPKLDGYETCKRLKADPETKDLPVILLSAKGRNVDQKVGFEVGADDYITKPFSPAQAGRAHQRHPRPRDVAAEDAGLGASPAPSGRASEQGPRRKARAFDVAPSAAAAHCPALPSPPSAAPARTAHALALIALPVPVRQLFTYRVPEGSTARRSPARRSKCRFAGARRAA